VPSSSSSIQAEAVVSLQVDKENQTIASSSS